MKSLKNKSVKDKLDFLIEKAEKEEDDDDKPSKKGFKLPRRARISKRKARLGYTTIMYIMPNRSITFKREPIKEQTTVIEDVPRIATADETLFYKGKPFIIQPSWSTKPFSPTDNLEETEKYGYAQRGWAILTNRLKSDQITAKRSINGLFIFVGIVAIIFLGYLAYRGGWFS